MTLEAQVRAILAKEPKLGRKSIGDRLGVPPNGELRYIVEKIKAKLPVERKAIETHVPPSEQKEFATDTGIISTCRKNVRTLDELIAYMRVDLTVWEVERHVINKWEVVGKPGSNNSLKANTESGFAVEPLYQVKAWLKRRVKTVHVTALEQLITRLEQHALRPQKNKRQSAPRRPAVAHRFLLEVSLFDAHFGLLAWGKETGEDYDLKISEQKYQAAVEDLLQKTRGCAPERIVFPLGNDFFHVNNPEGVTPAGHNALDVDGRLAKVLETGELAVIRALESCSRLAPVTVLWIPGNHDPETSFYLCRIIKAYFRNDPRVKVDCGPSPRKYLHYGQNLIGYPHGNEERHADLPTIMAGENRGTWGRVKYCEWHVGHLHKQKETRYSASDTYGGIIVRTLPSLAGTDAWHFKKGYVNGRRIAEANLYDHDQGPVATYHTRDFRR